MHATQNANKIKREFTQSKNKLLIPPNNALSNALLTPAPIGAIENRYFTADDARVADSKV
jgi:hypothetical protein